MKSNKVYLLGIVLFILSISCVQQPEKKEMPAIIPYPKMLNLSSGEYNIEVTKIGIQTDTETEPLSKIIEDDLYRLSGEKLTDNHSSVINLSIDDRLEEESYQVEINKERINIKGGSYQAVTMGWTSVIQAASIKEGKIAIPGMTIEDKPDLSYRGLMLDLARQFHSPYVIKQMIDVCRWYKIRYLHLHLLDEWTFVYPSQHFPKAVRENGYYTQEQLKDIISYAQERGVIIIPELEGPGHSAILRKEYPELFGLLEYDVLDLSSEKMLESMKLLTEEIMDSFSSSPYFHIGADEVNLNILKNTPHVIQKIKEKGYTDVHDLYLDYLCELHQFVKSKGKKTLVWEGFKGDGSDQVKIPKDIIVCVFETLFERPDSLAQNGYQLLNTSWKPLYITQTRRWSPEKIYNWNYYTWENFWEKTPAAKEPIILNEQERKNIIGAQLCAWEMPEEMEYPAISKRLAAVSERIWNTTPMYTYQEFEPRMIACEGKLSKLIYPIDIIADGLTESDYKGVYNNRENYFSDQLSLSVKSRLPNTTLHFTTDKSFPTINAPVFPEKLVLTNTSFLKIGLYDEKGTLLSYYPVLFENRPLKVEFIGKNYNDNNPDRCITFDEALKVKIIQLPAQGSVHYTLDGSDPSITSPEYTSEIAVNDICGLRIQYYDQNGQAIGEPYGYFLCPQKEWYELLRFNYRW